MLNENLIKTLFVQVKNGEAFLATDKYCHFCGLRSPFGHLFIGQNLRNNWYINRQGWISNKSIQICNKCLAEESYQEILEDLRKQIRTIKKEAFNIND